MSNLLDKSSLVLTPTAYNNGKILSVKPNTSVGDFDFTRNSSATRVNSQGLIEDVQILGSNLVTNGDFATDSDWSKDAGWTISNGTASCNGLGVNSLQQSGITTVGKIYKLTFDVLDSNNFNFLVISTNFGDTYVDADSNNAVVLGENTFFIRPTNGTGIRFRVSNGTTLSIDNLSIIEITEDTNIPRIDYTGGVGHWLFEPQSTNLIPYSENFSQSNWIKQAAVILTPNQPSPDGGNNAYKVQGTIGSSYVLDGGFGAITPQSRSIYMRAETNGVIYSLGDGQSKQINVTTEWQRFEFQEISNSFYAVDFRGSGVTLNNVYIWGAQLEQQSFATSYIPTSGSTVTRLQDAAFGAGSTDLINSTEGVLYAEIEGLSNGDINRVISISDETNDNLIFLRLDNSVNRVRGFARGSGGAYSILTINGVIQTDDNKFALVWDSSNLRMWVNGVERGTTAINSVPSNINTVKFTNPTSGENFFGKTKCLAVFKEALTDAELTCLTTI